KEAGFIGVDVFWARAGHATFGGFAAPAATWPAAVARSHISLCVLASSVEWRLREAWAPFLFDDEEPEVEPFEEVTTPSPFDREVFARVGLHSLVSAGRREASA
ncbi:MAG: hypothetical protein AB1609_13590, partial [Bacillota bacterium]